MNKLLLIQGVLYALIGALTPVAAVFATNTELTKRTLIAMAVTAVLAGCTSLKAFLSTTFADSTESIQPGTEARVQHLARVKR